MLTGIGTKTYAPSALSLPKPKLWAPPIHRDMGVYGFLFRYLMRYSAILLQEVVRPLRVGYCFEDPNHPRLIAGGARREAVGGSRAATVRKAIPGAT